MYLGACARKHPPDGSIAMTLSLYVAKQPHTCAHVRTHNYMSTRQGFRGRGGSTTQRLDGAIYAASNAALMLAQMQDSQGALKEVGFWLCA